MPFVVDSGSATAIQHSVDHLYAELARVLSSLEIPSFAERFPIEEFEENPPEIETVDGEIVEKDQALKLEGDSSSPLLLEAEENQALELEGNAPIQILPGEELAGHLKGSNYPQLGEASPVRLLAPGDEIRLEVGDETIASQWATFPEALKQLPPQKIIEVCQAVEQPENTTPDQINPLTNDSVHSVDSINLTVNGISQFQRDESGAIALNNLYPAVASVQAEAAENQAAVEPETAVLSTDFSTTLEINQDKTGSAAVSSDQFLDTAVPSTSGEQVEQESSDALLQPLDQSLEQVLPAQNVEGSAIETIKTDISNTPVIPNNLAQAISDLPEVQSSKNGVSGEAFGLPEFTVEEVNHEPESQLLPLGEIERVTGQELVSGSLQAQVSQQCPSMTAHRNALGQFTATQSIKAHVEATEDKVETAMIQQAETQIDLSLTEQATFESLDSFLQQNRDVVEGEISDRASGMVIQSQDNGGFVATNADGQTLSFDGNQATGDTNLVTDVIRLVQKTIEAALAHNASCQAETCEDIERD